MFQLNKELFDAFVLKCPLKHLPAIHDSKIVRPNLLLKFLKNVINDLLNIKDAVCIASFKETIVKGLIKGIREEKEK